MRKMPVSFHQAGSLDGAVIYRAQNSDLREPSQGVHWSRTKDAAMRFSSPAKPSDDPRKLARTNGEATSPVGYHIVEAVIDNPREQVQPPSSQSDWDFRYDEYKGPGILRNGSLSSEKEVRLRPGAKIQVKGVTQFNSDGETIHWPGAPSEVTIEHKGRQRYGDLPSPGAPQVSPSPGREPRTTKIPR